MRYFSLLLVVLLASCSPVLLSETSNHYQLPTIRGVVAFKRVEVKKGVKFDEFYKAARVWFRENQSRYGIEWERPVYETTLLHSGEISTEHIGIDSTSYYANLKINYLITVDAKDDSCRVLVSNFLVKGLEKNDIMIEKLGDNKVVCQSVNQEINELIDSLATYIRRNSEKAQMQ